MAIPKQFLVLFCFTSLSTCHLVGAQLAQQIEQPPTSGTTVATTTISPCNDHCQNGGICVFGGTTFQEEQKVDDFRCACQPGWTGPTCSERFNSCNDASPCENNGQCVLGLRDDYNNEQYFCDCSTAKDENGNEFVGKICEHQAVHYCNGEGDFCVNGECNPDFLTGTGPMCLCNEGHGGPHCEFAKGDVPNCDLDCQHGGHCVLGETTNAEEIYHYWDTSENQGDQMHCRCKEGYDGPLCEHRKTACGDGHCFNGSQCVEKIGTDGKAHFHCDCTAANTDDASFAGRFCQYRSTSYCTNSQHHTEAPLFCVNNGRCKEDVYEGCECDAPFTGFSCEFRIPNATPADTSLENTSAESPTTTTSTTTTTTASQSTPSSGLGPAPSNHNDNNNNLQTSEPTSHPDAQTHHSANDDPEYAACKTTCQNNGICRKGAKDLGALEAISHDIAHLNQTFNDNFEHCVCPPGFTGVHCETKVEVCGEGMHLCLHGSKCVTDGEFHACDCSKANDGSEVFVAGRSCEHKATDICTTGELGPGKPLAFCTNGGTCKAMITSEEPHPGCNCSGDWTGPHCELRVASEPPEKPEEGSAASFSNTAQNNNNDDDGEDSSNGDGLLVVEIVFLMFSLVLLAACILYGMSMYIQKKKNQAAESVSFINDQEPYKDEPNISPHRDVAMDPFPRRVHHSSSSDPFVSVVEGESTRQASRTPSALEPVEIC